MKNKKENEKENKSKNTNLKDQDNKKENIGKIISPTKNKKIYCLTIIGQIEGHTVLPSEDKATKYENVIPELVAIEEDPNIDGVLFLLNTVGGDIEAGLAIAELISGMDKPTVSVVIGGGHSIGVPLAVAAKKSFIVNSATMTVHPVRTSGTTVGVSQSFDYFKRMQERIANFVVKNSKISKEKFYKLCMNTKELAMDIGTILEGADAVKVGIIDNVGTLSEALKALYEMISKTSKAQKNST